MHNETSNEDPGSAVPVVVFADFVCPWSYIVQDHIDRLVEDYHVTPLWKPHWLHPEVPPEGTPREETGPSERRTAMKEWMKELSPEKAATMRSPEKLQYSFHAFEALAFAEDHGKALPFKTQVFDALWVQGKDIAETVTLQDAAEAAGLSGDAVGEALEQGHYRQQTLETLESVRRAGISQTPTIILGRTMIPGYHYYEVMQTALEKQGILPKAATQA